MNRLPRSVDDLSGLRAARWIRESTRGQQDRYGPDAQREQQDRAIERFGLVDTGTVWSVAHSGRTIGTTPAFSEMLEAAGRSYDVLLVGYVSRFARDLETAVMARKRMHAAGATLLFCDERVLSSDPDAWETWARETVEAEAYSRRLGRRIREGYAAKFRRLADPAGPPPLGFRRTGEARTLAIDPSTIGAVVRVFERYALGDASYQQVGDELGLDAGQVREILRNTTYIGFVRRHRRSVAEERIPAPWHDNPPVSRELWDRVQDLRAKRTRSSGQRSPDRPAPLLSGLLYCPCGARIRGNGKNAVGAVVIHPPGDCPAWGERRTYPASMYEQDVGGQITGMRVDDATMEAVVRVLAQSNAPRPPGTAKARLERRRRDLALEHAANKLTDADYMAGVEALRREEGEAESAPLAIDPAETVAALRELPALWADAPNSRRSVVTAVYERIVVRGDEWVTADLTPWAEARGLAWILPSRIELVSREGDGRSRTIALHIEGAEEWDERCRRLA